MFDWSPLKISVIFIKDSVQFLKNCSKGKIVLHENYKHSMYQMFTIYGQLKKTEQNCEAGVVGGISSALSKKIPFCSHGFPALPEQNLKTALYSYGERLYVLLRSKPKRPKAVENWP
jgi:hypothetical protein